MDYSGGGENVKIKGGVKLSIIYGSFVRSSYDFPGT
jgi:hypothetical protein